ncbi:class F sortase [Jatrophihabitans sp.]|uniref:class F sortase n=1 Tax=Jatrophihabitans sp. TaxID=1932789 RepID=UPI002C402C19|nr:class F sortase [Jatrophihabitans sp.]
MPGIAPHARRGRLTAAAAGVLVAVGVLLLVVGLRAQRQPPQPPAAAAVPYSAAPQTPFPTGSSSTTRPAPATPGRQLLARSVPVTLEIPAIKVRSELLQLGLNPDRTVQVPPLARDSRAGWYKYSPTPGQLGPSVILGHVDSAEYGPGIFFRLGALRPGSTVTVTRADRSTAVFRVDRVVSYPKDHFPTLEVYGNTDNAQLRLITCGGRFDFSTHNYQDNIVAFATLVSSKRG